MKKILLTGSLGFIGSNFIRQIVYTKQPYTIVSIDKSVKSSSLNNIYQNRFHSFYMGDISDVHFMDRVFEYEKPDIVVSFAAETHVDDSMKDPNKFINSNVLGTQVIVNNCVKWQVERLILISTDEVYGQLMENDPSWTEESPLNPRNFYSASKAASELIVKAAHSSFGLNYNITRSSNNYGPRQTPDKLIPKIIKCVLNNQKIPIYGKGLQIRDWTYVSDNCSAVIKVLNDGKMNETYNISANQECTNIEIVQKICNILGKGHSLIEFIEDPRSTGHDFRYSIDCSKIQKLGWKPQIKLPEGLESCVNWYLNNQWFLK